MSIISWNCNGVNTQFEELKLLINDQNPAVLCLQETHLKPCRGFSLKHFKAYRNDKISENRCCGGVLTAVHKDYHSELLETHSELQALIVKVNLAFPISICNIYLPPTEPINEPAIIRLINSLESPYIVIGDLNGSHQTWSSSPPNTRGNTIRRIIDTCDSILLNTGKSTYISPAYGSLSAIDLAISSPNLTTLYTWDVINNQYGSDHFPTILQPTRTLPPIRKHPKWIIEKADWKSFSSKLQLPINNLPNDKGMVHAFTSHIIAAAEQTIPKTSGLPRKNYTPWFDAECRHAVKEKNSALRIFQSNPTSENLISYKKQKAKIRRLVKIKKKQSWITYVESININTPIRDVWKKIRNISGSKFMEVPILKHLNHIITDPQQLSETFVEHFSEISGSLPDPSEETIFNSLNFTLNLPNENHLLENYNSPITLFELNSAIEELKNSSPGHDEIHNLMIKNFPHQTKILLLQIFNKIWDTSEIPDDWLEAIVIPILKPGNDKLQISNYRPISLTSCLCKLLEKIINKRLLWILESQKLLSPAQCGFRKGRSTIDHLISLEANVLDTFVEKKEAIGVFFDFEKAYDTIKRSKVLKQLFEWGLRGQLPNFIKAFLSQRYIRVRIGSTLSSRKYIFNGIPQGSVLSCVLFAIAINSLNSEIPPTIKRSLFVDDLQIFLRFNDLQWATRLLQNTLNKLNSWAKSNNLKFSLRKTKSILFSRKRNPSTPPNLTLEGMRINFVNETKFLGLIVDTKLTWVSHIKSIKEETMKRLNLMKVLSKTSWGADRHSLIIIYKSLIQSKIDYGSIVYSSAKTSHLLSLDTIHHTGIRLATGAFRTSPITSICAEAEVPPLFIRRQLLVSSYLSKIVYQPSNPAYEHIFSPKYLQLYHRKPRQPAPLAIRQRNCIVSLPKISDDEDNNNFGEAPFNTKIPQIDLRLTKLKKDDSKAIKRNTAYEIIQTYSNKQIIYTDGSKQGDNVGLSVVLNNTVIQQKLNPIATIFTAEMQAIRIALYHAISSEHKDFMICTDSLSSLMKINKCNKQGPLMQKILKYISMLEELGKTIVFLWIPSHTGILGNEKADKAAKEAALAETTHENIIEPDDIKTWLKWKTKSEWENMWKSESDRNKLRAIKDTTKKWNSSERGNRREEVVLTRMRIGHTNLTHVHLINKEPPPKCPTCDCQITVQHIIEECPAYQIYFNSKGLPRRLPQSLGNNPFNADKMITILKEIDIFTKI